MAQIVCLLVSVADRACLAAIVADRNRPQKHVARARIILHSAERLEVAEVARRSGISRPAVWRWQQRFAEAGVDGLLRDKTRKPGKPPTPDAMVRRVVALTCAEPPGEATHWTGRAIAQATGLSLRTVQRIWTTHKLQPHRIRSFKHSRDPEFIAKLEDIVGLYMTPPRHAVVLSVDEKSQIQALDRTQPGLPIKPGKAGTMTHDYIRHGTTTLFAALNVLDGTVIGRCISGTGIRSSSASSMRSRRPCQPASSFTPSSITTPAISTLRSALGSPDTRAGPSTTHRLLVPG